MFITTKGKCDVRAPLHFSAVVASFRLGSGHRRLGAAGLAWVAGIAARGGGFGLLRRLVAESGVMGCGTDPVQRGLSPSILFLVCFFSTPVSCLSETLTLSSPPL